MDLQDHERVMLLLYLKSEGEPEEMSQVEFFAKILGWDEIRVERAIAVAAEKGFVDPD